MREDPQESYSPHLPRHSSTSGNLFAPDAHVGGISLREIETHSAQLLRHMEQAGAKLAERIPEPILINSPLLQAPAKMVLTTRWLARGAFGVLFRLPDGEILPAWIPIRSAMLTNPTLTPSGTFAGEQWDQFILTSRTHVLPREETLARAAQEAARTLATKLLEHFPSRIDLAGPHKNNPEEMHIVRHLYREATDPLLTEIADGMKLIPEFSDKPSVFRKALIMEPARKVRDLVLGGAFQLFKETQLQRALSSYRQPKPEGLLFDLMHDAAERAALSAAMTIRQQILQHPVKAPDAELLSQICAAGLRASLSIHREFTELWLNLSPAEKPQVCSDIGAKAWSIAAQAYGQTN